ncbi:MAG: hypothetical protein IT435_14865 [Phycisphaerales bacterium]|nr:hypothetical protein [Phycisphaerales bacterium]
MRLAAAFLRMIVGAALLLAVAAKFAEPMALDGIVQRGPALLAARIEAHGVVPPAISPSVAILVIVLEVVIGLALLFSSSRAPVIAGIGILTVFSTYLALVYHHQRDVDCGCFGTISAGSAVDGLVRNAIMTGALIPALLANTNKRG